MANNLFNLNDLEQFPVLQGVSKYLDEFTPYDFLEEYERKNYNPISYNGSVNKIAIPEEQAMKDIEVAIAEFRPIKLNIRSKGSGYIDKLIGDRESYFLPNIPVEKYDVNKIKYNELVIEQVEDFCNFIEQKLSVAFHPYFNEPEKVRLNIRAAFRTWYEKFNSKDTKIDNAEKDESELQEGKAISNKKIKWLGNASHLGYIIYQLANKGFIEFPNYNGEINYTGLAERVLNAFEFKDKEPNKKYMSEQINPESENNKISKITKGKLKIDITDLKDLS